ncbi:MAG: tetratricopeptide repeat protein [Planctomycetes bacterium]|nr:tetratricopeptide repeat protein [Planctomycetota bacterium]
MNEPSTTPAAAPVAPTGEPGPARPIPVLFWTALIPLAVAVWAWERSASAPVIAWADPDLVAANDGWRGVGHSILDWAASCVHGGVRRPLAWLSLAADDALVGSTVQDLRVAQAALHGIGAACVGLTTYLLIWVTGAAHLWRVGAKLAAGLAATAWAIHPLRVESVMTLSARGDLLAVPLLCACTAAWTFAVGSPVLRKSWVALAAVAAGLAGLAWPAAVGVVVALGALTTWIGRVRPESRAARGAGGALALVAAPLAIAFVATLSIHPPLGEVSAATRAANFTHVVLEPFWTTLWPAGLHPAHCAAPGLPDTVPAAWWTQAAILAIVGWLAGAGAAARRGASLSVLAALAMVGTAAALATDPWGGDRLAHVATLPLFVAFGVALGEGAGCWLIFAGVPLVAGLIVVPVTITRDLVREWATAERLEDRVLRLDPGNDTVTGWRARPDIAGTDAGSTTSAVAARSDAWVAQSAAMGGLRPRAALGMAQAALARGDADEGLRRLQQAAAMAPWLADAQAQLGNVCLNRGRIEDAVRSLEAACRLDADRGASWFALGRARALNGDRVGAAAAFERAVALDPSDVRARQELLRLK